MIIIFPAASFPGNNRFRCEAAPLFMPNELKKKKDNGVHGYPKTKEPNLWTEEVQEYAKYIYIYIYITQWMLPTFWRADLQEKTDLFIQEP